jgi:hypothetical protein
MPGAVPQMLFQFVRLNGLLGFPGFEFEAWSSFESGHVGGSMVTLGWNDTE